MTLRRRNHQLEKLKDEIHTKLPLHTDVRNAVDAGHLLIEARKLVDKDGETWSSWLDEHIDESIAVVRRCVRLAKYANVLARQSPNWSELTVPNALKLISKQALEQYAIDDELRAIRLLRSLCQESLGEVDRRFQEFAAANLLEPSWLDSWRAAIEFGEYQHALGVVGRMEARQEIPRAVATFLACFLSLRLADRKFAESFISSGIADAEDERFVVSDSGLAEDQFEELYASMGEVVLEAWRVYFSLTIRHAYEIRWIDDDWALNSDSTTSLIKAGYELLGLSRG